MGAGEKGSRLFPGFCVGFGCSGFFTILYLYFGFPHFSMNKAYEVKKLLSMDTWESVELRETMPVTFHIYSWEIAPGTSLTKRQQEKYD